MTKDVVILHGWGGSAKSFAAFADVLERKGYKVHSFDLPGFGTAEPPPKPWSVDDYVAFVKEFCERNGLSRFFLMGHSFGGRVSIKFAARYPDRLAGLVLYAAAGIKPKPSLKRNIFLVIAKIGSFIFSLPILQYAKDFMTKVLYRLAGVRDYRLAQGTMKDTMKNVIGEDLAPLLSSIHTPTLIVWGDRDTSTPVEDARRMNSAITGSQLKVVTGATHISLHREEPDKLADLILPFLSNNQ